MLLAADRTISLGQVVLKNDSLARTAAILFCLNPCGIFMSSLYTESLFAFLSFYGMLLYVQNRLFLASLVWAAGSLSRANGIVYVGFFVWELLSERRRRYIGLGVYQIGFLVKLIVCSLIVIAPFALFQLFAYDAFCTRLPPSLVRPWCESKIPLIYSFVQKEYWNNGFLSYYEVKQIPNFLLAAPFLGLSILGLHSYYAYDPQRFWTLGLRSTKRINRQMRPYFSSSLLPFIYLWAAMTFLVSTMMHVQVILRFFTCLPPLYWFLAHFLVTPSKKTAMCSSGLLIYWVFYPLVGAVLFANFYPPA